MRHNDFWRSSAMCRRRRPPQIFCAAPWKHTGFIAVRRFCDADNGIRLFRKKGKEKEAILFDRRRGYAGQSLYLFRRADPELFRENPLAGNEGGFSGESHRDAPAASAFHSLRKSGPYPGRPPSRWRRKRCFRRSSPAIGADIASSCRAPSFIF